MKKESSTITHVDSEKEKLGSYGFSIISLAGNDTALISGIPTGADTRTNISNQIMGIYPNVEQVGFLSQDSFVPSLVMAGGEFCGNSTLSAAWKLLNGEPQTAIQIEVSGVSQLLQTGISADGEPFAQMPIFEDPSKIQRDPENNRNFIVEMEGITHYIDFDSQLKGLTGEQIKIKAKKQLEEQTLLDRSAAGVIYAQERDGIWQITPVVYVRDTNVFQIEHACGSGSIALGMALAVQKETSIESIQVEQPSKSSIKVSIDYDGERFHYAQIQGPAEELATGTLESGESVAYAIERVRTEEQLKDILDNTNLIQLYKDTFATAPYHEQFLTGEVKALFLDYVQKGMLFLAKADGQVVGFGAMLPINSVSDVKSLIQNNMLIDTENCWYMADLGVKDDYRHKEIGRKLVQERIAQVPSGSTVVMRTSINNVASQSLYFSEGFTQLEEVTQTIPVNHGSDGISRDTKVFFVKKIGSE